MADVRPFRALRFDHQKVGDLSQLLSPPFDIISPTRREELYDCSPFNIVRLEYGRPDDGDDANTNVYTRAATFLGEWIEEGVLTRDEIPAYYLVSEEYEVDQSKRRRVGFYAGVRLEGYERGIVLPHEQTRPGPKEDRLRLMEACEAVFSPLMFFYRDTTSGLRPLLLNHMELNNPELIANHGGVLYKLWVIHSPMLSDRIREVFNEIPLYLVDGHHRYETALAYRDAQWFTLKADTFETPSCRYRIGCLIGMDDPGSQILSFHRLISQLSTQALDDVWRRCAKVFDIQSQGVLDCTEEALSEALDGLEALPLSVPTFGVLDASSHEFFHLMMRADMPDGVIPSAPVPELGRCESWLLHQTVLDPVVGAASDEPKELSFLHDLREISARLIGGECQMLFLVRSMNLELFEAVVQQGQLLPPKATYFDPKLPTGLVMQGLDGEL